MITSGANHYIKTICSLHHKKGRVEHNLYLAEGIHLVQEALRSGAKLRNYFWSAKVSAFPEGGILLKQLQERVPGFEVNEAVMAKIAETENPQGIVATLEIPEPAAFTLQNWEFGLILDGLQDPGNVGTILRTAWASGIQGLICTPGTADLFQGKVVRASMGGIFYRPGFPNMEPRRIWSEAKKRGVRIIAGDAKGKQNYFDFNFGPPALILVGNEGRGLSPDWDEFPVERVQIPQPGRAESLNVSISAALLIYEAIRQKMSQHPQ